MTTQNSSTVKLWPRLRGGANTQEDDESTPSMVQIAIQNAESHGINLHHGVPNLANGDCIFESVADSISTRPCFRETWSGSAADHRKLWMEEAEDLVLEFSGGAGMSEKQFRREWALLKETGNYEFGLGDFVLAAIAHCTRKDILVFNIVYHSKMNDKSFIQKTSMSHM